MNASQIARSILMTDRNLPSQVFRTGWDYFEFFSSDDMTRKEFISTTKRLMKIEGSKSACFVNLDYSENNITPAEFHINQASTESIWELEMHETLNWMSVMVRIGVSTDLGGWCVYCDPIAEIAVMGFQSERLHRRAKSALKEVYALPIRRAIANPPSFAFQFGPSTNPNYWDILIAEYGQKS
jgi:hypothetical protein